MLRWRLVVERRAGRGGTSPATASASRAVVLLAGPAWRRGAEGERGATVCEIACLSQFGALAGGKPFRISRGVQKVFTTEMGG